MKILSTEITNFLAISHAKVALADRGLVLVQGSNPDESSAESNGSGKSSFADAIAWCFYGITARGEDGDKVVNRIEGKDCSVINWVQDGPDAYSIQRYRKHKTFKNNLMVTKQGADGVLTDLTKGTTALTQEVVNQILGCSHEVFTGAVYAGQEKLPDLPGMTDKQLKMLIEEASGATLLEAAYQEASSVLNDRKAALATTSNLIARFEAAVADAKERFESAHEGAEEFNDTRATKVRELVEAAKNARTEADGIKAAIATHMPRHAIEWELAACDAAIAAVKDEQTTLFRMGVERDTALRELARYEGQVQRLKDGLKRVTATYENLDHQIGCPCPSCDRPFSEADIEPGKRIAAAEIAKQQNEIEVALLALAAARDIVAKLTEKRDAFAATMTDTSAKSAERASLQGLLDGLAAEERRITSHNERALSLARQAKSKKDEVNPFDAKILDAHNLIVERERALKETKTGEELAIKAVHDHEAIAKVFSPSGVRAFLLDEVTPFLNDQTAKYLGTLSDGHIQATWTTLIKSAKGDLREKFSIEVVNATGGDTFKLISGGEKRKVRIACALALQDLVARRATKPIELFIADEVDSALDTPGLERFATVLAEKASERGSVFVISHSDIKDWFSQVMIVKKVGGKATIEEVTA